MSATVCFLATGMTLQSPLQLSDVYNSALYSPEAKFVNVRVPTRMLFPPSLRTNLQSTCPCNAISVGSLEIEKSALCLPNKLHKARRWQMRKLGFRGRSKAPAVLAVKCLALEATEEEGSAVHDGRMNLLRSRLRGGFDVSSFQEDFPDQRGSPDYSQSLVGGKGTPLSLPTPPRNRADDVRLNNPLKRLERMGCGWFGIVMEWEGVIVEDDGLLERKAWTAVALEEGKPQPLAFILKRAEGMKNEQAVSEVLCWGRDVLQVRRLARRKEELYEEMQGGTYRVCPGSREFVQLMKKHGVPIGIASTRPRKSLERAIEAVGMEGLFEVIVSAEDCYRGKPDPEMFQYASELMGFIPERVIVIGNNNASVEAAHDALMKCVAVAGKHPAYELNAADLVVRRLDQLSVVDFKNLADIDSPEFTPPEPPPELEFEPEEIQSRPSLAVMERDDDDWL
eukprot:TRINITY_DN648_c0_g1_i1.p1 TRINITY_DN648_c0_g1~~TRINITY_DN648_c0_g1_i1.p1  ORF type:complete len:452 (-),score=90.95 TRINITY_DN648_c0_g1_i1:125-1480(-)